MLNLASRLIPNEKSEGCVFHCFLLYILLLSILCRRVIFITCSSFYKGDYIPRIVILNPCEIIVVHHNVNVVFSLKMLSF